MIAAEEDAVAENTLPYRIKPYLVQWPKTQCSIYTSILNKIYRKLRVEEEKQSEKLKNCSQIPSNISFSLAIPADSSSTHLPPVAPSS